MISTSLALIFLIFDSTIGIRSGSAFTLYAVHQHKAEKANSIPSLTSVPKATLLFSHPNTSSLQQSIPHTISLKEEVEKSNKRIETALIASWIATLSSFIVYNNYIGPWPKSVILSLKYPTWMLIHALSGMMFAGGIIITTLLEWIVVDSKEPKVTKFWYSKVPMLDSAVVLPAVTTAILSGNSLAVLRYGSLGEAPLHIKGALHALVAFCIWWATTDLTTQAVAARAGNDWEGSRDTEVPRVLQLRKISNIVSCLLVVVLYGLMILKPRF